MQMPAKRTQNRRTEYGEETKKRPLVEEALAVRRAAQAGDAVVAIPFTLELVVVRELLIWSGVSNQHLRQKNKACD